MKKEIKEKYTNAVIFILLALALSSFLFGITGIKTFLTLIILYFLPIYLILNQFSIKEDEKIIYSIFIALGVIPSISYWISLKLTSLSTAVIITFFILIVIGFLIKTLRK